MSWELEYTAPLDIWNIATRSLDTHPFSKLKCMQSWNVQKITTQWNEQINNFTDTQAARRKLTNSKVISRMIWKYLEVLVRKMSNPISFFVTPTTTKENLQNLVLIGVIMLAKSEMQFSYLNTRLAYF